MPIPQTASGTTRDRENKSFVNSPSRGDNYSAQEVFVGNKSDNSIPTVDGRGPGKPVYNEIIVNAGATIEIATFTVPTSKVAELLSFNVSGENRAKYVFRVNSQDIGSVRTYYTYFNEVFVCNDIRLNENDKVSVFVENNGEDSALFNATIFYKEFE